MMAARDAGMKIAFVYDAIYPYVKGGAERRYYELAKKLCVQHEVHLFGMKFWEGSVVIRNADGIYLHGVCAPKSMYVQGRRSIYQALYFSLRLIVPLMNQDFDLVDCSSVPFFPIFVCKLYALLKRKPLVVTWHEYLGEYWFTYLASRWKALLARTIEFAASRLPNCIVAVSEHTKADLVVHGVPLDSVRVVNNGLDVDEIRSAPISTHTSDLIFVGRLIRDKNVDVLLQAVRRLCKPMPEIKCNIVGDGPEKPRLLALRTELGLESHVQFLGFLEDHGDVYGLMRASRVFVLPSEREGFGLVILEANACGLPVVVAGARHSAAASLVQDGESGRICNLDAQEFADAAHAILQDHEVRARMQRAALAWARRFDWSAMAAQMEDVYREAAR